MFNIYGCKANSTVQNVFSRLIIEAYMPVVEGFYYYQKGLESVMDDIEAILLSKEFKDLITSEKLANEVIVKKNINNFIIENDDILSLGSISLWKKDSDICILDTIIASTTQEDLSDQEAVFLESQSTNAIRGSIWVKFKEGYAFNAPHVSLLNKMIIETALSYSEKIRAEINNQEINGRNNIEWFFKEIALTKKYHGGESITETEKPFPDMDRSFRQDLLPYIDTERLLNALTSPNEDGNILLLSGQPGTYKTSLVKRLITDKKARMFNSNLGVYNAVSPAIFPKTIYTYTINRSNLTEPTVYSKLKELIDFNSKADQKYTVVLLEDIKADLLLPGTYLNNFLLDISESLYGGSRKVRIIITTNDNISPDGQALNKLYPDNPIFRPGRLFDHIIFEKLPKKYYLKLLSEGSFSSSEYNIEKSQENLEKCEEDFLTQAEFFSHMVLTEEISYKEKTSDLWRKYLDS